MRVYVCIIVLDISHLIFTTSFVVLFDIDILVKNGFS